jgi:hypothetical protein
MNSDDDSDLLGPSGAGSGARVALAVAAAALPALDCIWDCEMIKKVIFENGGQHHQGWLCGFCPLAGNRREAVPFKSQNATKALCHVLKFKNQDIRTCLGNIPADKVAQYKNLYERKVLNKEQRQRKISGLMTGINDRQTATIMSLQSQQRPV